MKPPLVLGIHVDTHDTGAAIVRGLDILAAVNEERLTRVKEDESFPAKAIASVMDLAGLQYEHIDVIAVSGFHPSPRKLLLYGLDDWRVMLMTRGASLLSFQPWKRERSLAYNLLRLPLVGLLQAEERSGSKSIRRGARIMRETGAFLRFARGCGFRGETRYVPHHICHLATAFYTSGFDEALLVNVEGSSFIHTANVALGGGGTFEVKQSTPVPHSAGEFYKLITAMLGFHPRRHAGKITGLAAYGDPGVAYDLVRPLLRADGDGDLRISDRAYRLMASYRRRRDLPEYFQGMSREDLSAAFQARLEDVVCEMVGRAMKRFPSRRLALCGGVAANVKMNQRLAALEGVEEIFIHPGMGDTGQALGAALAAAAAILMKDGGPCRPRRLPDVFLGPEYSEREILESIRRHALTAERPESIEYRVAELLAAGHVVARFSGRMEYGPRALGNRSILYRPDEPTVNDWLNDRLKRTEFMPFAPMTLEEFAGRCYVDIRGKEYASEFMTITCNCTEWMKKTSPGVVHVDGTARPQIVRPESNPGMYRILKEYHRLAGLPSVINTSFNMHEEPIVCTPDDAIRTFLLGHLDYLAIGPFLLAASALDSPRRRSGASA